MVKLKLPVNRDELCNLKAGEWVSLEGPVFVARDQAHLRLLKAIENNQNLPVDLEDQAIIYAGPIVKDDKFILGPTTSSRMDELTEPLLKKGLALTIGKGLRSEGFTKLMPRYKSAYLMTFGGAAALLSQYVSRAKMVAYGDLGPEAIFKIEVNDFPAMISIDCTGKKARI